MIRNLYHKPPSRTTWQLILIGLLILCFSRCQTAKQLIDKAEKKDAAAVAKYTRDKYPCTDLLKPDTLIINQDTIIMVDCPEGPDAIVTEIDTVKVSGGIKTVKVPIHVPVQIRYITKWFEDSSKVKLAVLALSKSAAENAKLKQDLTAMTSSRNWYRKWFWILALIIGIGIGFTIFKIVK